jgi:periplasmic divalent cation tolerance protein
MEKAAEFYVVMVTAPDLAAARNIVGDVLERRLAACGNIINGLESHYWWHGKLEQASEVLILFKAMENVVSLLEDRILQIHPYDTPEVIALNIASGSSKYLKWIVESVNGAEASSKLA